MKNKKLVVIIVLLITVLGISVYIYPTLKEGYEANTPSFDIQTAKEDSFSATDLEDEQGTLVLETAPDFTVLDMDGNTVALSDYFGKPIVVNFWATWCGPCKSELPAFESKYAEYGEEITFLMVNLTDGVRETVEGTKSFAEKNDYSFPIYFDTEGSADAAYGIRAIPMTVFINSDGSLLDYSIGAMNENTLVEYLEKLISK